MSDVLPYVTALLICETVLVEKDGTNSIIRAIDSIAVRIPDNATSDAQPAVSLVVFLQVRAGNERALGDHVLSLRVLRPNGEKMKDIPDYQFNLAQEESGQNVTINSTVVLPDEGIYWFELYVDKTLCARQPLTVVFQRQEQQSPEPKT